jgi:hypothetical protein
MKFNCLKQLKFLNISSEVQHKLSNLRYYFFFKPYQNFFVQKNEPVGESVISQASVGTFLNICCLSGIASVGRAPRQLKRPESMNTLLNGREPSGFEEGRESSNKISNKAKTKKDLIFHPCVGVPLCGWLWLIEIFCGMFQDPVDFIIMTKFCISRLRGPRGGQTCRSPVLSVMTLNILACAKAMP